MNRIKQMFGICFRAMSELNFKQEGVAKSMYLIKVKIYFIKTELFFDNCHIL